MYWRSFELLFFPKDVSFVNEIIFENNENNIQHTIPLKIISHTHAYIYIYIHTQYLHICTIVVIFVTFIIEIFIYSSTKIFYYLITRFYFTAREKKFLLTEIISFCYYEIIMHYQIIEIILLVC